MKLRICLQTVVCGVKMHIRLRVTSHANHCQICARQSTAWHHVISTNCASQFRLFPTFLLSVPLLVVIWWYQEQV